MDADAIIEILGLTPLPREGGFFRETYRSGEDVPLEGLPARYGGSRQFSTAIYYLLREGDFSAMHRLRSDEVFHFYSGDPVEMLQLHPDGSWDVSLLGPDLISGQRPQVVVPAGVWQGCRLVQGGRFALMGTTVSPGFDSDDYEHGERKALARQYPQCADLVRRLTREFE